MFVFLGYSHETMMYDYLMSHTNAAGDGYSNWRGVFVCQ
jgi:hypothetical protein